MLWRQGDVYISVVSSIPDGAKQLPHTILADGELTGHSHRINDFASAVLFEARGQLFIDVVSEKADVVHEEHGTIQLKRGKYRIWRQREFDPVRDRKHRVVSD
jgi:hypothetical protein